MADLTKDLNPLDVITQIAANVKNEKLSDKEFRRFVYDSMPPECKDIIEENRKKIKYV